MKNYIVLLRGINVSGQKKVPMAELRILCDFLGFQEIQTYIQTGNILFKSKKESAQISKILFDGILEKFGFEVEIFIQTPEKINKIIQKSPFKEEHPYVTFLSEIPKEISWEKIKAKQTESEEIHIEDDILYFNCPDGYGKTKLSNNFFEKLFQISATTRNWKTLLKLQELSIEYLQ